METDKCCLCGDESDRIMDYTNNPVCFYCHIFLTEDEFHKRMANYIRSIKIKNILNGN